jgi:Asp-tRNA(Asn)/Glu-tRNA(Gln) amidotransferase A subunit family amidase
MTVLDTAAQLRSGALDLREYLGQVCDRIEADEPALQALVPGTYARSGILQQAANLLVRYPDPASRPLLFGVPVGIKDIFRADGYPTRCGSALPAALFEGPEAPCVTRLRENGAIFIGKTATTEFAFFEPGPTRNPHNPDHTPGGSSSGSAAGTARGYFLFALGSQTIGSTVRPAGYCGVIGFVPSFGRISTAGVIPLSPSADHVGLFSLDASALGDVGLPLVNTPFLSIAISHQTYDI